MKSNNISTGFAEIYGAMIGDGCLSRYYSNSDQRERYCILLTGHTHDEPYYRNTIQPFFYKEFGTRGCIRFRKKENVTRFETLSKRIFSSFESQEFPVGLKGNKLKIPKIIFSDNLLAIACVRGIFDTDGSVYQRYSKQYPGHARFYDYKVIQFKLNSCQVITQVKHILLRNGMQTNRIIKDGNSFVLRITLQKDIKTFFVLIKPSNKYHVERYLNRPPFSKISGLIAQSG